MKCICGSGHDSGLHEQAVNKTRIGSLGSDRTVDQSGLWIGSDQIGSDWYFHFWCRRIILTKAVFMPQVVGIRNLSSHNRSLTYD